MRLTWAASAGRRLTVALPNQPDLLAADQDRAFFGHLQHVDTAQKGGLARSRRADDRDNVAAMGLERNSAQNLQRAKSLVYITRFNRRHVRAGAIARPVGGADHAYSRIHLSGRTIYVSVRRSCRGLNLAETAKAE